jgi:hypothetical protein
MARTKEATELDRQIGARLRMLRIARPPEARSSASRSKKAKLRKGTPLGRRAE